MFFPYDSNPLKDYASTEEMLIKVLVPHKDCRSLLSSLYRLGLRFSNLYPELTFVSKDILLKTKVYEYLRETNDLGGNGKEKICSLSSDD